MASINVSVRLSDGSKMDVSAVSDGTVLDLKKVIETKHTPPVTPDRQKIVFKGRILKDEDLLSACGVEEGTAVHLVVSKAATAASPAPAAAAPSATSTATPSTGAAAPGSAGMAGNPFAAMMGGMGGMPGGMPGGMGGGDPMAAMMNNPAMMQMAVQMLSQPGFLEMMEASNPMLQQMFAANPQMRDMMRNPQFLQMAMNPQTMQMMQAMGGMGGMGGLGGMAGMPGAAPQAGSPPATGGLPGSAPNPMANMAMLQAMMGGMGGMPGGMGGMGGMPAAPADTRPPAERFASQLTQMREMGFTDDEQNIRALSASGGNVQFAVERILDGRA